MPVLPPDYELIPLCFGPIEVQLDQLGAYSVSLLGWLDAHVGNLFVMYLQISTKRAWEDS